ncbi:glutathione-disulfide reductase [Pararhizobium mangrovi]|uniref:Glutathione reductase n=1 Tax=Pararhizobium mangrovi TaxID=2590452 RepID=A0A506UB80_9HYPH|nr:glutathione-disulfide reductase [Pararhizobium mangrovi]TPW31190.1 glutathione-disulfide reductase [Pararhizobium mangrovi]
MAGYDYDLFVIGGGSGGVRAARRASSLGKRVAIAEEYRYGGTCVIRGCVPKKLFVYASQFSEAFEDAAGYGWTVGETRFDWPTLIANKDGEISRLEGLYRKGLDNAGATILDTRVTLRDAHTLHRQDTGETVSAETILIATGGRPNPFASMPGHELCITSDEAFHLETLPKAITIAGGGYIAVEFANIFNGLGVDVTLVQRGPKILSDFDEDLRDMLDGAMREKGIRLVYKNVLEKVERGEDGRLRAHTSGGEAIEADTVMLALGRTPNVENLGLEKAGVETARSGAICVDGFSKTNVDNIYAIGDVTDRLQLTPVAIHEAMCFVETVFRNNPTSPDHELVPTAVFSHPEIGTVGITEAKAAKDYAHVEVYRAEFRPMKHTLTGRNERMMMKIIVNGTDRTVLGVHLFGADAGELAQTIGIALKAGATKDDFDRTMAVHPTASEELVTMYAPSYVLRDGKRLDEAA